MKEKSIIQQNLKKIIGVIVVSVFAIITIYTVFRGSGISLNELTASLKEASWEGILLASVSMLGFIYFEGEALRVLVRHMGYPAKRSHGFVYSAADVYFSAITPSASGGQPGKCIFYAEGWNSRNSSYGCAATESYYVYPCDSDDRAGRYFDFSGSFSEFQYRVSSADRGRWFSFSRAWDYLLSSAEKAGIDRICRYLFCPDFTDDSLWEACR